MRGQSVGIFPIHNSTPEPMVTELEKIMDSGEDGLSQHMVKLQPISRSNAILVVARKPELLRVVAKWISRLDASAVASTGVKVYKVRYGDCRQIAKLLSDLFIGGGGSTLESPVNQIAPGGGASSLSSPSGAAGQSGFSNTGGLGGGGGGGGLGAGGGLGGGGGLGPSGGQGGAGGLGGNQSQSQGVFGSLNSGQGGGQGGAPGSPTDQSGRWRRCGWVCWRRRRRRGGRRPGAAARSADSARYPEQFDRGLCQYGQLPGHRAGAQSAG